jgi:hypothetical protein
MHGQYASGRGREATFGRLLVPQSARRRGQAARPQIDGQRVSQKEIQHGNECNKTEHG